MSNRSLRDGEEKFKLILRRNSRSRHIRITVSADGSVLLTRPFYVNEEKAISFLNEKMDWVRKKLKEAKENTDPDISIHSLEHYREYKDEARRLVEEKVEYWNRIYGFRFNRISIRNQKSRWGSCSSKKNLNFNYKIIFLKEELQDYLIVHELCHLKHMDHSKKFWQLVERTHPEHKTYSEALRGMGGRT